MKIKTDVVVYKVGHIISGWGKRIGLIPSTPAEKALMELRMKSCRLCSQVEESTVLVILKGNATSDAVLRCKKCSCPCEEKAIVVDEKCPLGKW